jgi:hypothetical protein
MHLDWSQLIHYGLIFAYSLLEYWIGKNKNIESNSVIEFVYKTLGKLLIKNKKE